jgi:hypothetical protein
MELPPYRIKTDWRFEKRLLERTFWPREWLRILHEERHNCIVHQYYSGDQNKTNVIDGYSTRGDRVIICPSTQLCVVSSVHLYYSYILIHYMFRLSGSHLQMWFYTIMPRELLSILRCYAYNIYYYLIVSVVFCGSCCVCCVIWLLLDHRHN